MVQKITNWWRYNKKLRPIVAGILLLMFATLLGYYLIRHPNILQKVAALSLADLVVLLLLYTVFFIALVVVMYFSLLAARQQLNVRENILLNAYSALTNFFGPGQSGPGVRAVYLKAKLGLPIKKYLFLTLIYYACYAILSAVLLFSAVRPWWLAGLLIGLIILVSMGVLFLYRRSSTVFPNKKQMTTGIVGIFAGTALQMVAQVIIYYVELASISAHASLAQVVSFTGAANFSLFVALTPGAIGIRESFLIFSEQLHHISSTNVIAAGVIDRAVYVVFLGLLFVLILSLHAKGKFDTFRKQSTTTE